MNGLTMTPTPQLRGGDAARRLNENATYPFLTKVDSALWDNGDKLTIQTSDGGTLFAKTIDNNIVLAKLNANGQEEWTNHIQASGVESVVNIAESGASYGFVGTTTSLDGERQDLLIGTISKGNGSLIIAKALYVEHLGVAVSETGYSIEGCENGGFIFTAFSEMFDDLDTYETGKFIGKLSESGNLDWANTMTNLVFSDTVVKELKNGQIALSGEDSNYDYRDPLPLVVLNADGTKDFATEFDTGEADEDVPYVIADDSDGNIYLAGDEGSAAFIIKTDHRGNQLWQTHYEGTKDGGGNDRFTDLLFLDSGNLIAAGKVSSFSSSSYFEAIAMEINPSNGNVQGMSSYEHSDGVGNVLLHKNDLGAVSMYVRNGDSNHYVIRLNDNMEVPDCHGEFAKTNEYLHSETDPTVDQNSFDTSVVDVKDAITVVSVLDQFSEGSYTIYNNQYCALTTTDTSTSTSSSSSTSTSSSTTTTGTSTSSSTSSSSSSSTSSSSSSSSSTSTSTSSSTSSSTSTTTKPQSTGQAVTTVQTTPVVYDPETDMALTSSLSSTSSSFLRESTTSAIEPSSTEAVVDGSEDGVDITIIAGITAGAVVAVVIAIVVAVVVMAKNRGRHTEERVQSSHRPVQPFNHNDGIPTAQVKQER